MFTGLIEGLGTIRRVSGSQWELQMPWPARRGESIAVDGVCLTVARRTGRRAWFDVGPETRAVTTLGRRRAGSRVNLERALRVGDRLGGHWVTGHVEATGRIRAIRPERDAWWVDVRYPQALKPYMLAKGSIALDGISLTIAKTRGLDFTVMIIPHTWTHTTLQDRRVGDRVNLESDLLARYAVAQVRGRR